VRDCGREIPVPGKKSDNLTIFGGKFDRSDPKGLAEAARKTRFASVGKRGLRASDADEWPGG